MYDSAQIAIHAKRVNVLFDCGLRRYYQSNITEICRYIGRFVNSDCQTKIEKISSG